MAIKEDGREGDMGGGREHRGKGRIGGTFLRGGYSTVSVILKLGTVSTS